MDLEYGSDVVADLLVQAGVRYAAFNPGATFRGLHDSLVHLPGAPEIVLCTAEGISVAVAQGYAKATGRPMAVLLHDIVGLQAASMAIYNAWCDRAPMLLIGGTGPMAKSRRRPWIDWIHTASSQAELVRDFVKWDDQPHDLASVPESFARALHAATSSPSGPVYLCYDVTLQEDAVAAGFTPEALARYVEPTAPAASPEQLDELAELLRVAKAPMIVAGYVGHDPAAFAALTELAEALAAPVLDTGVRHAFPTGHPLCGTGVPGLAERADVVLVLDVDDLRGRYPDLLGDGTRPGRATVVHAGVGHLRVRGWSHAYQALAPLHRHLTADADSVAAGLLHRVRAEPPDAALVAARTTQLHNEIRARRARLLAAAGIATASGAVPRERVIFELGAALQRSGLTFVLGNGTNDRLEHRLWDLNRPRQHAGWHAGGGLGYGLGASIGVALGSPAGTIVVDVQADGDALFTPSALWTMAHSGLPVLVVVLNNRQYGNSVGHAVDVAGARGRPVQERYVGTALTNPEVHFAALAESFGVWSSGPVSAADQLAPVFDAALEVLGRGRPALIDVIVPGL